MTKLAICPNCSSSETLPSKVKGYRYCTRCGKGSIPETLNSTIIDMDNRPKIYISSFSNLNYQHLDEYGIVVREPITAGFVDLSNIRDFYDRIKPIIEKIEPTDFLALAGTQVVGVVISQFLLKKNGMVRLLSFDKKKGPNGGYREVILADVVHIPDENVEKTNNIGTG